MSDTKTTDDKTISVDRKKTLTLGRGVEQGTVRQSFSHGRTKAVVVEKKKRRVVIPGSPEAKAEAAKADRADRQERKARPAQARSAGGGSAGGSAAAHRTLTDSERDARAQALRDAMVRDVETREREEREAQERAEEEARLAAERAERDAEEKRQAEEDARRLAEEEASRIAEEQAKLEVADRQDTRAKDRPEPAEARTPAADDEEARQALKAAKRPKTQEARPARRDESRRRTKLTITSNLDSDGDGSRGRSLAALRRRREKEKRAHQMSGPAEKVMREVTVPETITIQELANRMAERAVDVIKLLMKQGQMLKINDVIDADTAQLVAEELGHQVKRVSEADVEEGLFDLPDDDEADQKPRPPVVTIMGHVDHGKTSLLDALRQANVVAGEAGGITQHIGAYQVEQAGHKITFIDTPGHAAFTAMRARGAKTTDIVILVVAADDGVMPQTIEAINHAKAAGVPIIVAINKIDKPGADPTRVRTELLQHEIVVETMSGETLEVEVSATEKTNLDKLLDAILLQSELLELKANPDRSAEGSVIEAKLDKGRGAVATVLVERGTLHVGDIVIAGSVWGKVRALLDDRGEQLDEAGPSTPAEILGLQATPEAGDRFTVVDKESRAREVVEYRQRLRREQNQVRGARGSLEQMMSQLQTAGVKEFPLVIKGDVQGSVEAIVGALDKLGTDEVAARIVHAGVGGITESDVTLATASNAAIIGFNVRANKQAREASQRDGIEIRYYNIIYDLVDDVKAAMSGMLSPEMREHFLGNAEILEVFNISKVGKVAGCRVTEGVVQRGAHVRLIRDDVVIHEGKLGTLKRFKDEVKEVQSGTECGMNFENYQDMRPGDVIECYNVEEVARTL